MVYKTYILFLYISIFTTLIGSNAWSRDGVATWSRPYGIKLLWYIKGVGLGSAPDPQGICIEIFSIYFSIFYGYYLTFWGSIYFYIWCLFDIEIPYQFYGKYGADIRTLSDNMKSTEISSLVSAHFILEIFTEYWICTWNIKVIYFSCTYQYSQPPLDQMRSQDIGWRHELGHLV